jgi:hypothetical protein
VTEAKDLKVFVADRIPFNADTSRYKIMYDICSVHLCIYKPNQKFVPCTHINCSY